MCCPQFHGRTTQPAGTSAVVAAQNFHLRTLPPTSLTWILTLGSLAKKLIWGADGGVFKKPIPLWFPGKFELSIGVSLDIGSVIDFC